MREAQIIEISAGPLNARGQATARFGALPLFVPDLLPGERAEVQITRRTASYVLGQVHKLLIASPDRVVSDCTAFPRCGGCTVRHLSYAGQLQAKQVLAEQQCQEAGLTLPVSILVHPALQTVGYRSRAIHACAPIDAKRITGLQTGLYGPDSQAVVPIDRCVVEPRLHDQIRARLRGWAVAQSIGVWTRAQPRGLRHILVRSNAAGTALVVGLIGYDMDLAYNPLRAALREFPVTGAFVLEQRDPLSNTLLDGERTVLWGELDCAELIAGCQITSDAAAFFQLNAATTTQMAEALLARTAPSARLLEFYSGSGTFSLPLARRAQALLGFERDATAVQYARANAQRAGITTAQFEELDLSAESLAQVLDARCGAASDHDVILADPPRKGLSPALRSWMAARGTPRILLLACDGGSGARDAQYFVQQGYRAAALELFDMFPGTLQSEWLIDLQR